MYRLIKEQVQAFCTSTSGPGMAPDCQLLHQRAWRSCSLSVQKELSNPLGDMATIARVEVPDPERSNLEVRTIPANMGTKESDK